MSPGQSILKTSTTRHRCVSANKKETNRCQSPQSHQTSMWHRNSSNCYELHYFFRLVGQSPSVLGNGIAARKITFTLLDANNISLVVRCVCVCVFDEVVDSNRDFNSFDVAPDVKFERFGNAPTGHC